MLQTVPSAIKNAFRGSFIKKICNYLHDCVREEVKSSTFRNLKADKENKWVFLEGEEKILTTFEPLLLNMAQNPDLNELMIQSNVNQKERYLIYGYLFLVGKNAKSRKNNEFLTPILYAPASIERDGTNLKISITEDSLSLNTGAIAQLIQREDEQETDAMLEGLLDVVPQLPLKHEDLEVFLTTLKSLVPDIEVNLNINQDINRPNDDFYNSDTTLEDIENGNFDSIEELQNAPKVKVEKLSLKFSQAIILTTRPTVTAGVLHELTQISEKPQGEIRETVLNVINQEFLEAKGEKVNIEQEEIRNIFPVTPLSLSDSQEDVIKTIEENAENSILAVYGPPGTGKSQTIVNVAAHFIATGRSVLVASKMDKAVDVVAERLNSLNAPYLALRAGRNNYQRQLNNELQELLSNKIELNSGYDGNLTADTDDMKELLKDIKRLEDSALAILDLEKQYSEIKADFEDMSVTKLSILVDKYKYEQLQEAKKIFEVIEEIEEKTRKGFFDKIKLFFDYRKLKKLLKLHKILNSEILKKLLLELNLALENAKLEKIEDDIISKGNLHQILKRIKTLKSKQRKLAVDILKNKRRTSLKNILTDSAKRRRLMLHAKSLVSRKTNQNAKLLAKEDFKPLLSAFPCWCVTTYAISNSLPLKPGMFDVVIIDEASQCDIASCIPVLFRAKKAIIVGDDKQLPHLSFLEKAKEQSFLSQYNIDERYQLMWRYRDNSMFDLANYYSTSPVLLDEHFRSPAPIIEFSSREFYGGKIKIMSPNFNDGNIVQLRIVRDGKVDYDATRNVPECEEVVKTIQEIILNDQSAEKPVTIGVISPFRAQVDLIKKAIYKVFDGETILRHRLDCGTAHTYQGDERDIMLLSWTFAPNSHTQSLMFAQKPNLFNVAITRARHKLINFISRDIQELPQGLLRDYLEYVKKINAAPQQNIFKNDFEKVVFDEIQEEFSILNAEGKIKAGVEIGSVSSDIMIDKTIVEIDGVEDSIPCRFNDMKKQAIIERSGFNVIRITKREWDISSSACLDRVRQAVCGN